MLRVISQNVQQEVTFPVDGAKDGRVRGYIKEVRPDGNFVVQITEGLLDVFWVQRKYQIQGIKRDGTKLCSPDQVEFV